MRHMKSGFTHERNQSDHWLTPPALLEALGPFDLDPCAAPTQTWPTAKNHYALPEHDGLLLPWAGRVWCNPPYGPNTERWMKRCALHDNAIALVFARTETRAFRDIFQTADAFLFLAGRLRFYRRDGMAGDSASAPSVLIAWGYGNANSLRTSGLHGAFFQKAVIL